MIKLRCLPRAGGGAGVVGVVMYPKPHASSDTTWHPALDASCQVGSGDSLVLGYITQHYNDVIMGTVASQITSLTIVYSTVDSDADQREHQSSASLAFVRGIHRGPVNSPHKAPSI